MKLWSNVRGFCATIWSSRMSSAAASNRRLEGKVAIVTASTDGIGFGIAKQLVRDAFVLSQRSRQSLNLLLLAPTLQFPHHTVQRKPQHRKNLIEETLQHFGGIDILVSNAAVNPTFGPLLQTPEEAWDKIFDVNVKSAFLLAKDVIPLMEKRGFVDLLLLLLF
ncbi:unnamed protein product [Porites evermanni]|uniref:Uncharacterized protein n=1 Tax=Porites evermanni TaxID=104178 RepID=A0ABN8Q1V1_9CNID|nr:unnamed protein product [Porites evermanni]